MKDSHATHATTHGKFSKDLDSLKQASMHHATTTERLECIKRMLGDSAVALRS